MTRVRLDEGGIRSSLIEGYCSRLFSCYVDIDFYGPNESDIIGARTVMPCTGGGDWIFALPNHWFFDGTGMKADDKIPGLVGWESHGDPAEISGMEIIAEGNKWGGGTNLGKWMSGCGR